MEKFIELFVVELAVVLLLVLRKVGFWTFFYESIVTHPKYDGIARIVGEVFKDIGVSVIGAVIFAVFTTLGTASNGALALATVFGLWLIIAGALLREKR